ncbi:MAG: hypothetical protein HYY06_05125 [Deltaproteobacteria bacterium]|nr:hypothetical protein [Deltaproteobacteria bacterium]
MRYRTDLQPYIEIGAATTQEARFAVQVGNAKTGVACVNVTKNNMSSGTLTFDFETATDPKSPNWANCGTGSINVTGTGQTSLLRVDLGESSTTRLAGVVRWKSSGANATVGFDIVVFFADA